MGRFLYTLAVGLWLGTLVSFSYVFLPAIHGALPQGAARDLLRHLFPRYHLAGILFGAMALAVVAMTPAGPAFDVERRILLGAPVAVALLCAMIGRQVLLPRLAEIDAEAQPDAFARVHQIAAMLNTTALALLVLALAAVCTL